jgi:asparagine synthase (glutamine-hydrolysing)
MYAIAVWDRHERALWLVSDRFGKKPLYYARFGDVVLFASELKALRVHPEFKADLSTEAVSCYLRLNCVPAPLSIYRQVRKLPAASWARFAADGSEAGPRAYWSLSELARNGIASPFHGSDEEATEELDRRLRAAVRARLLASDVPVGLFLSGGVDSSTVTALAQAQSAVPVRTFSIAMPSAAYDERGYARAVAVHLGTDHTEWELDAGTALNVVPEIPAIFDEPFADSSAIPTLLVSRLARKHVTVALSGDGGDEVFGGYNRHVLAASMWPLAVRAPYFARLAAAGVLGWVAPEQLERWMGASGGMMPKAFRLANLPDTIHKMQRALNARSAQELYLRLLSSWERPEEFLKADGVSPFKLPMQVEWLGEERPSESMMLADALGYMHDDILVKVDRASMATSLEVRNPFLDLTVVEFAWRLPLNFKVRDGVGKWIVRKVMDRYIPRELTARPKMGFAIPLAEWLRGPLRDWAESLVHGPKAVEEVLLTPGAVARQWNAFVAGETKLAAQIWCLLMLLGWQQAQTSPHAESPAASSLI